MVAVLLFCLRVFLLVCCVSFWFAVFLLLSSVTNIVAQGPERTHMPSLPVPPMLNWPTQLIPTIDGHMCTSSLVCVLVTCVLLVCLYCVRARGTSVVCLCCARARDVLVVCCARARARGVLVVCLCCARARARGVLVVCCSCSRHHITIQVANNHHTCTSLRPYMRLPCRSAHLAPLLRAPRPPLLPLCTLPCSFFYHIKIIIKIISN